MGSLSLPESLGYVFLITIVKSTQSENIHRDANSFYSHFVVLAHLLIRHHLLSWVPSQLILTADFIRISPMSSTKSLLKLLNWTESKMEFFNKIRETFMETSIHLMTIIWIWSIKPLQILPATSSFHICLTHHATSILPKRISRICPASCWNPVILPTLLYQLHGKRKLGFSDVVNLVV